MEKFSIDRTELVATEKPDHSSSLVSEGWGWIKDHPVESATIVAGGVVLAAGLARAVASRAETFGLSSELSSTYDLRLAQDLSASPSPLLRNIAADLARNSQRDLAKATLPEMTFSKLDSELPVLDANAKELGSRTSSALLSQPGSRGTPAWDYGAP